MKVFIAGATGVLGRRLVQRLCARGDSVVGLARTSTAAHALRALGALPSHADLFDGDALARAADGCEVIVHAATAIPQTARPRDRDWATNDRIRRAGTQALTHCAAQVGARLYLQQSVIWVAQPLADVPFTEDTPPAPDPVVRSALDGERMAQAAGARHGFGVAVLRCGMFYGFDSAHTRMMAEALRRRRLPIFGKGNAFWSCLHLDDAADAFAAAAVAGRAGLWHVVDHEPVPVHDYLNYFAARLRAPPPQRVPTWLGRLLAGPAAVRFFNRSSRTS
ncbi:MAG TPA: NAD-dependent epimerase/dehydratase family protein, partial [Acidiferrobacteraceae bacterium]|nr:NAD-dependent epimerase/dehydratase family protein [Acidiferrobacteraceae bacterium]